MLLIKKVEINRSMSDIVTINDRLVISQRVVPWSPNSWLCLFCLCQSFCLVFNIFVSYNRWLCRGSSDNTTARHRSRSRTEARTPANVRLPTHASTLTNRRRNSTLPPTNKAHYNHCNCNNHRIKRPLFKLN